MPFRTCGWKEMKCERKGTINPWEIKTFVIGAGVMDDLARLRRLAGRNRDAARSLKKSLTGQGTTRPGLLGWHLLNAYTALVSNWWLTRAEQVQEVRGNCFLRGAGGSQREEVVAHWCLSHCLQLPQVHRKAGDRADLWILSLPPRQLNAETRCIYLWFLLWYRILMLKALALWATLYPMLPIPMIPSVALVTSTPSQSTAKYFVSGDTAIWQPACKHMLKGYKSARNIGLGERKGLSPSQQWGSAAPLTKHLRWFWPVYRRAWIVPIPAARPEASNTVGSWLGTVLEGMTPWRINSSTAGVFSWKFKNSFFDTTLQALTSLFFSWRKSHYFSPASQPKAASPLE